MSKIIKTTKRIASIILCIIMATMLFACTADKTNNNSQISDTGEKQSLSLKEQADYEMRHIDNPKVLATVNGHEITQVDMDSFNIDGRKHTIDELVKYYIIYDYGVKNGWKMDERVVDSNKKIEDGMRNDSELTDEYCQSEYGISLEEVIKISMRRCNQAAMDVTFNKIVTDEVLSGECPKKHPELASAYKKYCKSENKFKAMEKMNDAYYEMIAEDYDVVIY